MKLIQAALRSLKGDLSHQRRFLSTRSIASPAPSGGDPEDRNNKSFESIADFQQRIFGGLSGNNQKADAFYQKLDKMERNRGRMRLGSYMNESSGGADTFENSDDFDESFSTLSDGLDGRLKKAATYFEYDPEEVDKDGYSFRPDVTFRLGDTYDIKDLDLSKPGIERPSETWEFEVKTEEILRKADFRNVRFLANFITDAGIIIKRSQTGISAKAQRKVAREIKIARAFGLMPFTTMGQFPFVVGRSREELDSADEYDLESDMVDGGYVGSDPILDPATEPVLDP